MPQDEQAQLPWLDRRSVGELLRAEVVAGEQQQFAREYALEYQDWFEFVLQQRALALASHAKLGFAYIGDAPDEHKAGVSQARFQVQAALPLVMCERSRWPDQEYQQKTGGNVSFPPIGGAKANLHGWPPFGGKQNGAILTLLLLFG